MSVGAQFAAALACLASSGILPAQAPHPRESSPSLQTYGSEISPDGGSWTPVLEGTLERVAK